MDVFSKQKNELVDLLAKIDDKKLLKEFLIDLFTPGEFNEIAQRLQLIKMLKKEIPQREISKKLGISIAKVTRGSRTLLNPNGGFQKILKKYYK